MQITNQISYFIEELRKVTKLLQDLEREYFRETRTPRYNRLYENYSKRIQGYLDKVNLLGKVGTLIRVVAVGPEPVKMSGIKMDAFKTVEIFFSNISEEDVKIILKRDYANLDNIKIQSIILGKLEFLE